MSPSVYRKITETYLSPFSDFTACHVGQFKCANSLCIPVSYHCDGYRDCIDGSDESNCTSIACPNNKFLCPLGAPGGKPKCIPKTQVCDGRKDCEDNADEETVCCEYPNEFKEIKLIERVCPMKMHASPSQIFFSNPVMSLSYCSQLCRGGTFRWFSSGDPGLNPGVVGSEIHYSVFWMPRAKSYLASKNKERPVAALRTGIDLSSKLL